MLCEMKKKEKDGSIAEGEILIFGEARGMRNKRESREILGETRVENSLSFYG